MSSLTPATAAALDGPSWLRARRDEAALAFADAALPSPEEEIWRYSRVDQLEPRSFELADTPATAAPADLNGAVAAPSGVAVLINGRLSELWLDPELAGRGVRFSALADLADGGEQLGRVLGASDDALVLANSAFAASPLLLSVPRGVRVERPFVVAEWGSCPGGAAFSRLIVRAEPGAELSVVHQQRSDTQRCWLAPVVELSAASEARLRYSVVQDLGTATFQTATVVAEVDQQATVEVTAAAFGGEYARFRVDCRMLGRGGSARLAALYFANGDQMMDFRTLQDHRAPDCTSELTFKGVVDDRSHSVYSGMIRVRPEGRGTNAFQTNRNIKLSDDAWAESVPNLQIENNDVRCSHASTVGPIDADQRFYLESRGLPPWVAERLVVSGFLEEVATRLHDPDVQAQVAAHIDAKLNEATLGAAVGTGAGA
ncbi:MAG: Fe-S cluster assembly protein SufD [Acidimicrobiales bacterium]